MSERYKITAGSHVGWFLPLKGWGGTGAGISRGGTGHWWHKVTGGTASAPATPGLGIASKKATACVFIGLWGSTHPQIFCIFPISLHGGFLRLTDVLSSLVSSQELPILCIQPSPSDLLLHPPFPLHLRCPPLKGSPPAPGFEGHPAALLGSDVSAAPHFFPCILPTTLGLLPIRSFFYPKLWLIFVPPFFTWKPPLHPLKLAPELLNLTFPVASPQPGNDFSWLSQKWQQQP